MLDYSYYATVKDVTNKGRELRIGPWDENEIRLWVQTPNAAFSLHLNADQLLAVVTKAYAVAKETPPWVTDTN